MFIFKGVVILRPWLGCQKKIRPQLHLTARPRILTKPSQNYHPEKLRCQWKTQHFKMYFLFEHGDFSMSCLCTVLFLNLGVHHVKLLMNCFFSDFEISRSIWKLQMAWIMGIRGYPMPPSAENEALLRGYECPSLSLNNSLNKVGYFLGDNVAFCGETNWPQKDSTRWWQLKYLFIFTRILVEMIQFDLRIYVSQGLVQPPTRDYPTQLYKGLWS